MSKPVEKAEGKVVPGCEVLHGDCLEVLKGYPDEYFSACVTDPPYGLSKEPDVAEVMRYWLAGDTYEHGSRGFMGRSWDSFVPGPEYWREVYRTMKPGAHLLAFAGTRTWDLLSMAIRFAGFENRDTIRHHQGVPSLAWVFGSGFAKGANISKHIDKLAGAEREVVGHKPIAYEDSDCWSTPNSGSSNQGIGEGGVYGDASPDFEKGYGKGTPITAPATDAAKRWEGWHTSLKPAWEIILVFRKPLSASSVACQVLQNGCGALNVDLARVGNGGHLQWAQPRDMGYHGGTDNGSVEAKRAPVGRFPSNFLLSHVPGPNGCQRVGTKRVPNPGGKPDASESRTNVYGWAKSGSIHKKGPLHADPDGLEEVEEWACSENCPVAELDRQSGTRKSGGYPPEGGQRSRVATYGKPNPRGKQVFGASEGSASRFFAQFPGEPAYCQETPESDNSDVLSSHNDDSEVFEPGAGPGFAYIPKAAARERWGILKCKDNNHRLSDVELFSVLKPLAKNSECTLCGSELRVDGHTTQKPQSLMKYLLRLVVPPGGTVLDPFAGSGSTLVAACELGIDAVGVEADEEFVSIACQRIAHAQAEVSTRLPF